MRPTSSGRACRTEFQNASVTWPDGGRPAASVRGPEVVAAGGRPGLTWKRGVQGLHTCPTCGRIAEVDDRAANVLWWDEHTRGCALVVAS